MAKQLKAIQDKITAADRFEFDVNPIKGYPELKWTGKRPFRSTQYYPAQLKEIHNNEVNGWLNEIYWGDNLQVMSHLLKKFRGKCKLVYIDPPFDSKEDYKKKIQLKGKQLLNNNSSFEEKQYTDIWINDEYLQFLYERLMLIRELLTDDGTIYVHCDWHKAQYIRIVLDEIFGPQNFINEIIWKRGNHKKSENKFATAHDNIFFYSKSSAYFFKPQFLAYEEEYINKYYNNVDADGRRYQLQGMYGKGAGPALYFGKKLIAPPPGLHWRWNQDRITEAMRTGIIVFPKGGDGMPRFKDYLDDKQGLPVRTIWDDLNEVNSQAIERTDYPTQKPESLLERIIQSATLPGDIVFDAFMGSGTTQVVAMKLGRKFIGADINLGAIQTTAKRLINSSKELTGHQPKKAVQLTLAAEDQSNYGSKEVIDTYYTGFAVYNVNHYDIFRNPVQAKELLIEALEVQPYPAGSIWDGEKDGRKVKIMPINRIATKADLNEIVANIPWKEYEKKHRDAPTKPVDYLTLVCMGHEPDLAAALQMALHTIKIDIEVVDILRDKTNLEFKRDSEAKIEVKKDKISIKNFYPMNLLQKLSLMKKDVEEWRELVDAIMIDYNYDGAVFMPTLVDVPQEDGLVAGEYKLPKDTGNIKIKITDLLSETYEKVIEHGKQ